MCDYKKFHLRLQSGQSVLCCDSDILLGRDGDGSRPGRGGRGAQSERGSRYFKQHAAVQSSQNLRLRDSQAGDQKNPRLTRLHFV